MLVVVPTLNEAAHISNLIRELFADPVFHSGAHLVVADGGSRDGTVEAVQELGATFPFLHLIENPQRIQSAGINQAVRVYGENADILIRLDAHAGYPQNYCSQLIEAQRATGADAIVVPLHSVGTSCFQRALAWVSNSGIGTGGSMHRGGLKSGYVDHGHHALFLMKSFKAAGGYDETFSHNEDAEFDCRQRLLGARIYLESTIGVQYYVRKSASALAIQYFHYGKGRARTVQRHPDSFRLRQMLVPAHLIFSVLCCLGALRVSWLLAWPVTYLLILGGSSLLCILRIRSLCGLLAGPAAFIMHTAWACGFLWGLARKREKRFGLRQIVPLTPAGGE